MKLPKSLLSADDPALVWCTRKYLLHERIGAKDLWDLPVVVRTMRRQKRDGRFPYPGGGVTHLRSTEDYDQLETYQTLLELVSKFGLTIEHDRVARAIDFLFRCQTRVGDFRGIYGRQYSPNYSAAILAVIVEAGCDERARIDRCFRWLLSMRQDDSGWVVPLRTKGPTKFADVMRLRLPLEPDRTKPSSHLITGIVLRAFAADEKWRVRPEAREAGLLLASRFFRADRYPDRRAPSYWTKLDFPFRWTDLVSSLDALSLIGIGRENPDVDRAVRWLLSHRRHDGTWRSGYPKTKDPNVHLWVTFAACRVLARIASG